LVSGEIVAIDNSLQTKDLRLKTEKLSELLKIFLDKDDKRITMRLKVKQRN